jgi:hypothetical protein
MGPMTTIFGNPAVRILEDRLWDSAQKRYLQEHPADRNDDAKTIMQKTKRAYKSTVTARLKEAERKVKAKWGEFKNGRTEELEKSLGTVFRMSDMDWYSTEAGPAVSPAVIAAPYQLLKRMTAALLFQLLRRDIHFEDLDDETLQALCTYAANEKFPDLLEGARRHYTAFEIGKKGEHFVIAEIVKRDPYFLGDEKRHSLIDMVILASAGAGTPLKKARKAAAKKWLAEDRKNRRNDRRFTGDSWEIGFEELKSWASDS